MKIKNLALFFLLVFLRIPVYSQDASDPNVIYVINSFNYNVKGRTLPFMLNTKAELKIGQEIKGHEKFLAFIENKKQLLINERVLKDNVKIEYNFGEPGEDGKIPVDLEIYVEDTWNFIALPYPKYSSSSGLEIAIKARDYNFLGTMNALRLDLGYRLDKNKNSYYTLMLDTGIPFMMFGYKWFVDFDHDFNYRPGRENEFYYKNSTGLSLDLPIWDTTLTFSFHEEFTVNDELSTLDKIAYGRDFQDGLYMTSIPKVSWKIPVGLEVGDYGELTYTPEIWSSINHEIGSWELVQNRKGANFSFSHTLGFGLVNWMGNLRKGYSVSVSNTFSRFLNYSDKDWMPVKSDIQLSATGHFILKDYLGLSSRVLYRHYFNDFNSGAGDVIRGIIDDEIYADYIISLNIDLPIRILKIRPSEWFPDSKVMSIFDFDLQIVPVFDIALYKGRRKNNLQNEENEILTGVGMEVIVFPGRWRSLFFRASIAFDVSHIKEKKPYEIFIGMELFH